MRAQTTQEQHIMGNTRECHIAPLSHWEVTAGHLNSIFNNISLLTIIIEVMVNFALVMLEVKFSVTERSLLVTWFPLSTPELKSSSFLLWPCYKGNSLWNLRYLGARFIYDNFVFWGSWMMKKTIVSHRVVNLGWKKKLKKKHKKAWKMHFF